MADGDRAETPGGVLAPTIDCHAHVFHRGMPYAPGAHSRPGYDYPVERWLAEMARHGLTHGVIAAASLFGDYSDYTLEALAAHPHLRATVIVSPETEPVRLRELRQGGVVGVRLVWRRLAQFPDLTEEPWRGFLGRLAEAGLHVELLAPGQMLPTLLPSFIAAGSTVVIDHFGDPGSGEAQEALAAIARAGESGRCWVKLSAGFRLPLAAAQQVTGRLLAELGTERLLWGSDAPFINHEDGIDYAGALALYELLVPDPAQRAAIDRTAAGLFFETEDLR